MGYRRSLMAAATHCRVISDNITAGSSKVTVRNAWQISPGVVLYCALAYCITTRSDIIVITVKLSCHFCSDMSPPPQPGLNPQELVKLRKYNPLEDRLIEDLKIFEVSYYMTNKSVMTFNCANKTSIYHLSYRIYYTTWFRVVFCSFQCSSFKLDLVLKYFRFQKYISENVYCLTIRTWAFLT